MNIDTNQFPKIYIKVLITIFLFPSINPACASTLLEPINVYGKADALSTDWATQSTELVSRDEIKRIGADRLEDYADSIAGVLIGRSQAGISSNVYIRGFSLNGRLHLNGLRDNQRYYLRDPATVESVEFLKGLDSVLLGSGSPGGAVNVVTKRPLFENIFTLNAGVGNPKKFNTSIDAGSQINDSDWAWRTIIAVQEAETGRKNVNDDRFTFMPSILKATDKDEFFLQAEYIRQNRDFDFDNVFINDKPVYDVSYTDPRTDSIRTSSRVSAQYQYNFTPSLTATVNALYLKGFRDEKLVGFYFFDTTANNLVGFYRKVKDNHKQYSFRSDLEYKKQVNHLEHQIDLGFEFNKEDSDVVSAADIGGFVLDIFNPSFDFALPEDDALVDDNIGLTDKERAGFLKYRVKSEKLLFSIGLRQSHFSSYSTPENKVAQSVSNNHLSTSLGTVWAFKPAWKAFANLTESFSPNSGRNKNNKPFEPELGIQKEIGFRYSSPEKNQMPFFIQASGYQITQDNQLKRDPENPNFKIPFGEVRINGMELKTSFLLAQALNITASYTYYDSEITKSNDGNQGNQLHSVPKQNGSLKIQYDFSPKIKTTLIGTHIGSRKGDNEGSFKLPSYTRFDAGFNLAINSKLDFTLAVRNLTDENYIATGGAVDFLVVGRDRTITGNLTYRYF